MPNPDDFNDPDPRQEGDPSPSRRERRHRNVDWEDDDYPERRRRSSGDDGVSVLIPYNNPKALLAYYLGVFSLIGCVLPCVSVVLAPAAIVLGIQGMRYQRMHPSAKGGAHAIVGIVIASMVLVENIALVIFFVIVAASNK